MIGSSPPRRLVVTHDLVGYGGLGEGDTAPAQTRLVDVLTEVYGRCGLPFEPATDRWTGPMPSQSHGDATVDLFPPGVPEAAVVNGLVHHLDAVLRHHNRPYRDAFRLRLRTAVAAGTADLAANGFSGVVMAQLARIQNCPAAREAVLRHPAADLVVLLAPEVATSSVDTGFGLAAELGTFVDVPVKPTDGFGPLRAWLHVPPRATAAGPAADAPDEPVLPPSSGPFWPRRG